MLTGKGARDSKYPSIHVKFYNFKKTGKIMLEFYNCLSSLFRS